MRQLSIISTSGIGRLQLHARHAFFIACCTVGLLGAVACRSSAKKAESGAKENIRTTEASRIAGASSGALKPINVVFITLDTVRADHLHCYGDNKTKTPAIDQLAASGVLFEKAVTQAPLTLPSHASMFTGTNPNVHHVRDTGGFTLQPSSITLATILQKHGWNTSAFVSSFVFKRVIGFDQGFSVYDDQMPSGAIGEDAVRPAVVTVDHALAWLNRQSTQPFFVWVHFYDAHQPFIPPPVQFREQYPGDTYDAEIAYIDQQLGRFLDAVKKKSPASKTMIVLLSDHGESLGDHGEYHHGVFLYDSTIRIAWIMAGPAVPAGVHVQQQARTIDVLPTILDLLGGKASSVVQGTSLTPAFYGKPIPTEYSYEETMYPKFTMNWHPLRGIHTADWMYVHAPTPELYDLKNDPGELKNVIDAHPQEYRELERQLKLLSQVENNRQDKVVSTQTDPQTMERLRSLGYLGGSSQQSASLDSTGADPKDQVHILKLLHEAKDSPPDAEPSSRRIVLYKEALKEDPTNPAIYYDLSDEYQQTGQNEANLQLCLDAIQHGIRGAMILSRLGQLYLNNGDVQDAISYYGQAVQLDPTDLKSKNGLATAYFANGQLAEAENEYQQILAIQPYMLAYNGLGLIAMKRNDISSARGNFERAVRLDPNYASAELNLGVLCIHTRDLPCAKTAFRAFLVKASPTEYKDMIPVVRHAMTTVLAPRK